MPPLIATLTRFLLNTGAQKTGVTTPAFSLTKVLASTAIVVGPLVTLLVGWLGGANLTDGQYVTLTIALLAFVAILAAADVLARAYASAHTSRHLYTFEHPVRAHYENSDVSVLGAIDANTLIVLVGDTLKLVPRGLVNPPMPLNV
jgi:hypothetical protein